MMSRSVREENSHSQHRNNIIHTNKMFDSIYKIISSLVLVCFLTFFVKQLWDKRKIFFLSMILPGPNLIGTIVFVKNFVLEEDKLKVLWKGYQKYKGLYGCWTGPYYSVVVIDPEDVESVFCKDLLTKPLHICNWWTTAIGNGLLSSSGLDKNYDIKTHRKVLNPSLGTNMNKCYYELIRRNCILLEDEMEKMCGKGFVDIGLVIQRFCADAITESMYGLQLDFRNGKRDEVFEAIDILMMMILKRSSRVWYNMKFIYEMSEMGKEQRAATKILREFCKELFDKGLEKFNTEEKLDEYPETATLDVLLKAYKEGKMKKNAIIDEIMNMWAAGWDTCVASLKWSLLTLAIHKQNQNKAFEEIESFFKMDKDAIIKFEDLKSFPYSEMCLKESMRLFSTGPMTIRYSDKEFLLKSKNIVVPAGVQFLLSSVLTHRNPKIWKDPDDFIPERFSREESAKRHPYSYFPFSAGPRRCVGREFGKTLLITSLVHLLRKFEYHSDWKMKEIPLQYDIDVRTPWGCKTEVAKRKWK